MKKSVSFVLAAAIALSLSACGGALVDLNTPKSGELSSQYEFYGDSVNDIRSSFAITPEQADDVFIVLTSCGLDGKVTKISEQKDGSDKYFQVWQGGTSYDVYLSDSIVSKVMQGKDTIYPTIQKHNVLMDYELTAKDIKNSAGDSVVGQRAYIRITKDQLKELTEENYAEFSQNVVDGSGYNWVTVICDDGTGLCFAGSDTLVVEYGKLDDLGRISERFGYIALDESEKYTYTEYEK